MNEYLNKNYIEIIPESKIKASGYITDKIVKMLSENEFTISETRGLFCSVMERLETEMPITTYRVE
ncbi:hypothetical protein AALB39_04550 [Lachnospiraceae bacterium 54-53]